MKTPKISFILSNYRKKALLPLMMLGIMAVVSACSGGSGTTNISDEDTGVAATLTGVFLDGPVEGLNYQTATMNGLTDASGAFMYHEGETVTFMIGDIILGSAPGSSVMTPIDLVPGAVDETDPTVTNICRLLQSLDWDGDLVNGIMLTGTMRSEMRGRMIDFGKDNKEFNDYDVQAFFDTMNILGGFHTGEQRSLATPFEAQGHFRQTLKNNGMHHGIPASDSGGPIQSGTGMTQMAPNHPATYLAGMLA